MTRREDWPEALMAVIHAAACRPFAWGSHDCCLFVADCVQAMTGVDPAAMFRGRYRDQLGAARAMAWYAGQGAGLEAVAERIAAGIGAPEIMPGLARRGDVGLAVLERGPTLVLCLANHVAAPGETGLTYLPRQAARRAWRI